MYISWERGLQRVMWYDENIIGRDIEVKWFVK